MRDGEYLLLDWGDACVSHPFFTLAVTLDGVIAWGVDDVEHSEPTEPYRDAYLGPSPPCHGEEGLVAACTIARRLGWVCRAVNGYLAPFETEQTAGGSGCSSTGVRESATRAPISGFSRTSGLRLPGRKPDVRLLLPALRGLDHPDLVPDGSRKPASTP